MPLHSGEALILRTYKLGEADRIVVFLTRDRGKKRGVARGARRPRSRFTGALEPMTRASVEYFEKESRELVSLNYVEPLTSPLAARDPDALGFVEYFAELLDQAAQDADPDERLYRLGSATMQALTGPAPARLLARYFELWLLRLQGVYPSLVACQRCGEGLEAEGAWLTRPDHVLLCATCARRRGRPDLAPATLTMARALASERPERLDAFQMRADGLDELGAVHRALITALLDREPRSARVLKALGH